MYEAFLGLPISIMVYVHFSQLGSPKWHSVEQNGKNKGRYNWGEIPGKLLMLLLHSWSLHFPPKSRLLFNGLHDVMSQKIEFFA
jgi:hypothetical protein